MSKFMKAGELIMGNDKNYLKSKSIKSKDSEKRDKIDKAEKNDESNMSKESLNEHFRGRDQRDFINEANKIMRERMKNKGSTINSKSRLKSVILNDTKEICLKNYLIDLLKDKRTDINEKERNITKALRESETRLDKDYKDFVDFVEKTKIKQKNEESELDAHKKTHEKLENDLKTETSNYKFNLDGVESCIKRIIMFKNYGKFISTVLKLDFIFDELPDITLKDKNFDEICKVLINNFDKIQKAYENFELEAVVALYSQAQTDSKDLTLKEYEIISKYNLFSICEDENYKVIKSLEEEEDIDKDIDKDLAKEEKNYEKEFMELKSMGKDFYEEKMRLTELLSKYNLISKYKDRENEVTNSLEQKQLVDKDLANEEKNNEEELTELRNREKDFYEEKMKLTHILEMESSSSKKLAISKTNEIEIFYNYITELGMETKCFKDKNINLFKPKKDNRGYKDKEQDKKNIADCLNVTKEVLDILGTKEKDINNYITEIEDIAKTEDNKDLITSIIADRKKDNKKKKQLQIKQKQEQQENLKRQKAVERAQRVVIKGRKVPQDYPILKEKKKKDKDEKLDDYEDYEMLQFYDGE